MLGPKKCQRPVLSKALIPPPEFKRKLSQCPNQSADLRAMSKNITDYLLTEILP